MQRTKGLYDASGLMAEPRTVRQFGSFAQPWLAVRSTPAGGVRAQVARVSVVAPASARAGAGAFYFKRSTVKPLS